MTSFTTNQNRRFISVLLVDLKTPTTSSQNRPITSQDEDIPDEHSSCGNPDSKTCSVIERIVRKPNTYQNELHVFILRQPQPYSVYISLLTVNVDGVGMKLRLKEACSCDEPFVFVCSACFGPCWFYFKWLVLFSAVILAYLYYFIFFASDEG